MDDNFFPSEQVKDEKAFRECLFRYKELLYTVSGEVEKNELALRIVSDYYKESHTARVFELAELIYYKNSPSFKNATIQSGVQEPRTVDRKNINKPPNPFSKYRI